METCEAQSAVMNNLKELAKADQHLKNLSISYDMTNDERAMLKEKVEEAKEKNKTVKKLDIQNKRSVLESEGNKNTEGARGGVNWQPNKRNLD